MEHRYYNNPIQVRYIYPTIENYQHLKDAEWKGGIVYHSILICGDTGEVWSLDELEDLASYVGIGLDDVLVELSWVDINHEIWE